MSLSGFQQSILVLLDTLRFPRAFLGAAVHFFPLRTGSKLGISPLMLAAMNGHVPAVKLLLDMGSDINAQIETNRNTALTLACFQGRAEVVSLLLDRKANVEHRAKVRVGIVFPHDFYQVISLSHQVASNSPVPLSFSRSRELLLLYVLFLRGLITS